MEKQVGEKFHVLASSKCKVPVEVLTLWKHSKMGLITSEGTMDICWRVKQQDGVDLGLGNSWLKDSS